MGCKMQGGERGHVPDHRLLLFQGRVSFLLVSAAAVE